MTQITFLTVDLSKLNLIPNSCEKGVSGHVENVPYERPWLFPKTSCVTWVGFWPVHTNLFPLCKTPLFLKGQLCWHKNIRLYWFRNVVRTFSTCWFETDLHILNYWLCIYHVLTLLDHMYVNLITRMLSANAKIFPTVENRDLFLGEGGYLRHRSLL